MNVKLALQILGDPYIKRVSGDVITILFTSYLFSFILGGFSPI